MAVSVPQAGGAEESKMADTTPLLQNGSAQVRGAPMVFCSRDCIFKLLRSPGIDSKESTPPAYVAWRAGTIILFLLGS
jgi:hypothetical protein